MRDYEYSNEQIREAAPRMTLEAIEEQKRQGILTHSEAKRLVDEHFSAGIATDFEQWMEYMDPDGIMTEDEFDSLTVEEKLELIREAD